MPSDPTYDRPTHRWNDPDNDGHDCVACPSDSIWKCDEAAHPGGVLPPLTPIKGLQVEDLSDLIAPEDKAKLDAELARMAHVRKMALPGEQLP